MIGLWNIPGKNTKCRSILTIYVLYSLNQKPKSGYEMLAEIRKKSDDRWSPSKGTLYPILRHLQEQNLVEICKTDKRSKNIFCLTSEGKKALKDHAKQRKEWRADFDRFKSLFIGILGEDCVEVSHLIFDIKSTALSLSESRKKEDVINLLRQCLSGLKMLESEK